MRMGSEPIKNDGSRESISSRDQHQSVSFQHRQRLTQLLATVTYPWNLPHQAATLPGFLSSFGKYERLELSGGSEGAGS
jgi:hypothetical protein